jgi:hypothetical protein
LDRENREELTELIVNESFNRSLLSIIGLICAH